LFDNRALEIELNSTLVISTEDGGPAIYLNNNESYTALETMCSSLELLLLSSHKKLVVLHTLLRNTKSEVTNANKSVVFENSKDLLMKSWIVLKE
jgi:predicted metallo-beta-lactamase superfamily hydrolase